MIGISENTRQRLKSLIRSVPDFPKQGIVFRDITPLLADPEGLRLAIKAMVEPFRHEIIDLVVGAESRGFIFGSAVARELNCGFIPVRKLGKLPAKVIALEYELEYGTDRLEMHEDDIQSGQKILMVDDLLATGGTMKACCQLVEKLGGAIVGCSFLIELAFLPGRAVLSGYQVQSVISYDSE